MTPSAPAADLHLHTFFSDGTDSPEQIVEHVHKAGIGVMAITDHDNIEAIPIAQPISHCYGIELIPGIEMSASFEGLEVHILGYLFDQTNAPLLNHLRTQQQRRVNRVYETVKRLAKVNVHLSAEEILTSAGQGTVGRPHVARILLKHGYVSSMPEAFDKYLGPAGPGFVPGSVIEPAVIMRLLRDAGGIPVLAHPIYLKRDELIDRFAREGLMGVEAYHSTHSAEQAKRYAAIAERLGLVTTGGSDYHGEQNKEGVVIGVCRLDGRHVEALKSRHAGLIRAR